jgi:AraC-like DNA-binding protein
LSSRGPIFQEYYVMPGGEAGAIWRHSPGHRKPLHFHGHLELLVIKRGHATERIGNRIHVLRAGQLVWHLPTIAHEMLSASSDLDMRVIHAEPDLASAICREQRAGNPLGAGARRGVAERYPPQAAFSAWVRDLGWLIAGHPVVELRRADLDALLEDCDSTFDDIAPKTDQSPRLSRLLQNAWRASVSNNDDTQGSSLSELASCLMLEDTTLDRPALSRLLDVSEGHLSHTFQKELGTGFVVQRARVRVSRFVDHVERQGQNLLEAALSAGFGSYSQLYRTFYALVGMKPASYLLHGGRAARSALKRS